jgi:hypothetical protein
VENQKGLDVERKKLGAKNSAFLTQWKNDAGCGCWHVSTQQVCTAHRRVRIVQKHISMSNLCRNTKQRVRQKLKRFTRGKLKNGKSNN